ncbi:MAG: hypothetical protein Q9223_006095 [Gallowayella weberi]
MQWYTIAKCTGSKDARILKKEAQDEQRGAMFLREAQAGRPVKASESNTLTMYSKTLLSLFAVVSLALASPIALTHRQIDPSEENCASLEEVCYTTDYGWRPVRMFMYDTPQQHCWNSVFDQILAKIKWS